MDWAAFFEVHRDMPRQGPGSAEDVAWALDLVDLPDEARIVDIACGPGADTEALLESGASVLAIDKHSRFVAEARARLGPRAGLTLEVGDMAALPDHPDAPFDMIWCAGALYLLGLETGLRVMHRALAQGGVLAFSEPVFFTDAPSADAVAFWEGYPTRGIAGVEAALRDAGFEPIGSRPVSDTGWEAYYEPLQTRASALRGRPDLSEMLEYCANEPLHWRRVKHETGYVLSVARKVQPA